MGRVRRQPHVGPHLWTDRLSGGGGVLTEALTPGLVATVLCPRRVPCLTCYLASASYMSLVAQTWSSLLWAGSWALPWPKSFVQLG